MSEERAAWLNVALLSLGWCLIVSCLFIQVRFLFVASLPI